MCKSLSSGSMATRVRRDKREKNRASKIRFFLYSKKFSKGQGTQKPLFGLPGDLGYRSYLSYELTAEHSICLVGASREPQGGEGACKGTLRCFSIHFREALLQPKSSCHDMQSDFPLWASFRWRPGSWADASCYRQGTGLTPSSPLHPCGATSFLNPTSLPVKTFTINYNSVHISGKKCMCSFSDLCPVPSPSSRRFLHERTAGKKEITLLFLNVLIHKKIS